MTHADHDNRENPILDEPRPGHELRVARERAGISREFMAERLRLAVEQFDALEHDDYAELPPPAFVRGYFRAYARELRLDPDEYIAAYNRSSVSARDPEIRTGGGVTDDSSGGRGGMIGLVLIGLVAAGGIGAWWYQQRTADMGGGSGTAESVEAERAATDDRETGTANARDAAGGGTPADDGTVTDGGSVGAARDESDTDTASATADSADAETASTEIASAETTSAEAEATGATAPTANGEDGAEAVTADAGATETGADDDAAEQPIAATPEREPVENGGDESTGDGQQVADAGDTATGSGTEGDPVEDAAATDDGDDDGGTDTTATADEPGATSPAATDSPTRAATAAAGTGPDRVTLEFSARSWLEVYDDRERELVYTLYFGSEPITLRGWAPFEVFLGNSPAVTVRFNGEEIDKSAFTRSNNTARFVVDASGARTP